MKIYIAAVSRTLIGYCFCMMGSVFYSFYNKINIFILLFVSIFIYGYLSMNFGVYGYSYVWNDYTYGYGKIISFPLSLSGILMVISISKIIVLKNEFINKNGFIWIGKNSFHVMALHLSGFLLLNMLLTGLNPVRQMSDIDIYYRYANIDWIYFFFSTVFCIVTIKTIQKFSGKFFSWEEKMIIRVRSRCLPGDRGGRTGCGPARRSVRFLRVRCARAPIRGRPCGGRAGLAGVPRDRGF